MPKKIKNPLKNIGRGGNYNKSFNKVPKIPSAGKKAKKGISSVDLSIDTSRPPSNTGGRNDHCIGADIIVNELCVGASASDAEKTGTCGLAENYPSCGSGNCPNDCCESFCCGDIPLSIVNTIPFNMLPSACCTYHGFGATATFIGSGGWGYYADGYACSGPDPDAGCMDSSANNYCSSCTVDDGSCTYTDYSAIGCQSLDSSSCNGQDCCGVGGGQFGCIPGEYNVSAGNCNCTWSPGCNMCISLSTNGNLPDCDYSSMDAIDWPEGYEYEWEMEIDPQMDCMFGLDPFGICCAPSEQDECGVCDGDGSFCEEFEMPDITDCDGVDNGTAWWEENGTCNTSCLTETRDDCIDGTPCSACCYSNLEWICHPNDPYETNWIGGQCSTSDWTGQNPEMTPTGLFVWIDRCTQTDDPYFCWGKRKALFNVGQACSCSPQAAAYLGEYYSGTSNECGCTYAGEVEMEDIYISCCKIGYGVGGSCNATPIGTEIDCIDPGNACEDFGQCPTGNYYMPDCFSANSGCNCDDGEGAVDLGCGCNVAGPSGCDNVCGSNAVDDCAGACGGNAVLSGCDNLCNSTAEDDECGVCGGDCSSCTDCAGTCNGNAVLSGCDMVCNSNAVDLGCGCGLAGPTGCDNQCNSNAVDDECGICGGNCSTCTDCAGTCNGSAVLSGCDNLCNSNAVDDECGVCGGDCSTCTDCAGTCNGSAVLSGCDSVCNSNAIEDCAGLCGGSAVLSGCDNLCNSNAVDDCAGNCGGSAVLSGCDNLCNSNAVEDCAGTCGGSAVLSGCDSACNSNAVTDCAGTCGGSAVLSGCDNLCNSNAVDAGCGCGLAGPTGCDSACNSNLADDACGVCGGDGCSCCSCPWSGVSEGWEGGTNCLIQQCQPPGINICSGFCGGDACTQSNSYCSTSGWDIQCYCKCTNSCDDACCGGCD